jgi:CRISPR-associated endonuclease/helicase Cas3
LHPALTCALVEAWSMTSLEHHTGRPEIAPWLRGWVDDDCQTTVIWRAHLPVREGSADWARTSAEKKEVEAFFEAAPPHESEKLETETFRVADWLQVRAKELLKRKTNSSDEQPEVAATEAPAAEAGDAEQAEAQPAASQAKPLRGNEIAVFVLSSDGSYAARFTLHDLAQRRKGGAEEKMFKALAEQVLVVDARFGGLMGGMLDPKADSGFATADTYDAWSKEAGFRVRGATPEDNESKEGDWRFEDDFVLRSDGNGDPEERLVIEHYKSATQSEDARSVSRPQELAKHQSCAEQKAWHIVEKIGLSGHAAEALALAAFLHDEGKKAPRWQRAFKAPRDAAKMWPFRPSSQDAGTDRPGDPGWVPARVRVAALCGSPRQIQGPARRLARAGPASHRRPSRAGTPGDRNARLRGRTAFHARRARPRRCSALRAASETVGTVGLGVVGSAFARGG